MDRRRTTSRRALTRVRLIRSRRRWTQARLARVSGITQSSVSRIENGVRVGSVDSLCKLARALGCSVDELLGQRRASGRAR